MSHVVHTNAVLSDRYLLERELGRGGMGVVYQARDLKHAREVAVKVLSPEPVASLAAERFLAEIRTAAGLNHPNIVSIHDSGDADGILYYVMPRVEGEPLSARLQRERRLPMDEALEIARQVADGLAYAHARGVVHRDIKPDNILLDRRGHASITDFGVARALSSVSSTPRTAPGMAVGSPLYMSPEQAAGQSDIDGRSDIYSLGCMLFEMLAGEPPFSGGDIRSVLRRHLTEPPPSLRLRRADVPPELDRTVQTALAKSPEERHPSASAFVRALESSAGAVAAGTPSPRRGREIPLPGVGVIAAGAAVVVLVALVYMTFDGRMGRILFGAPRPDTSRYAVLPLRRESGTAIATPVDVQLHDAFARWHGLEVVDRLQVADAVARSGGSDLTGREALEVARSLGAGRYVHGAAMVTGDLVRLDAGLYDAVADGRTLRQASLHVPLGGASPDSLFARLAESLLFGRATAGERPVARVGTESVAARRDYGAAHEALEAWDLSRADSLFRSAATHDPDFARAHLWLAQIRNWAGDDVSTWSAAAEEAFRGRDELGPREGQLAAGLMFLVRGEYDDACRVYGALRERDGRDFAAWYGLGECHSRDVVVVRDRSSPSGWSFRSSYHRAVEAYARAFEVLPLSHRGFTASAFRRVRDVLFARRNKVRTGEAAPPEEGYFLAWPTWQGDTLAFVPHPWRPGGEEIPRPSPELRTAAVLQQRLLFRETARSWARSFPGSPDAIHAVAVSLQMMGDPAALDTIRRARSLARDAALQLRLASEEVWIRVRLGVPDRPEVLAGAVALADSLLDVTAAPTPEEAGLLSRLAALLGRPAVAARLGRLAAQPVQDFVEVPLPLARAERALLVFSAAGAPQDSIALLEREAEALIRNTVPPGERAMVRAQLLERPAILAFPTHRFQVLDAPGALQSPLARSLGAWWRDDRGEAGEILDELRADLVPAAMGLDVVYPIARLLVASGDAATARSWLEAALSELRWTDPGILEELGRAGVLGRALALLATLAEDAGREEAARRWATPVTILWGGSERWLHPTLTHMRRLVQHSNAAGGPPTPDPPPRSTP